MARKPILPKRHNRAVQLGDMVANALDPALKRRGFASRDLITHWAAIAPRPWDRYALPDKLVWPRRGQPDPEGAVLHLRCREGHGLALTHESQAIAKAVNRYFGYLLVGSVRLSPLPLAPPAPPEKPVRAPLSHQAEARIATATRDIADEPLRHALEKLGQGVLGARKT